MDAVEYRAVGDTMMPRYGESGGSLTYTSQYSTVISGAMLTLPRFALA
jgi:hypothetical protein